MWRYHRWCWLIVPLLLAGCTVRLLYSWLDWIIPWKLDDYFQLTPVQRTLLDSELRGLLRWHRQAELPGYVITLRALSYDLARPLSERQAEYYFTRFEQSLSRLSQEVAPSANRVAASLSEQQITHFIQTRQEKQQRRRQEWEQEDGQQVHRDYVRKLEKNCKRWLGSVEPAQQPQIQRWADWQQQQYPRWLDYQDAWLATLDQTFKQRGTPAFEQGLTLVLQDSKSLGEGRFADFTVATRANTVRMLSELTATLTPRQRRHLRNMLNDLASDLESLRLR